MSLNQRERIVAVGRWIFEQRPVCHHVHVSLYGIDAPRRHALIHQPPYLRGDLRPAAEMVVGDARIRALIHGVHRPRRADRDQVRRHRPPPPPPAPGDCANGETVARPIRPAPPCQARMRTARTARTASPSPRPAASRKRSDQRASSRPASTAPRILSARRSDAVYRFLRNTTASATNSSAGIPQ